ncbi:hypothetical protein SRABI128_06034 [Microbacterium sp. Bi128]|nr:hypothetical protein SRABI128_06034 [Microbacterium sp. Bi128]
MAMKVPIMTAMRICRRYWRKAVSEPICISPASTRWPPNQSTAAVEMCRIMPMAGNISTNREPIFSETSVRSWLAAPKRSASWGSRTKARTTRMPMICSRRTPLSRSIFSCMERKSGMRRTTR